MAETKRNRNALRSRRMLIEAFSELLAEKPFEKITVADVTRRADLNRGTFYAHFDSIDALSQSIIDDVMEKLFVVVDAASDKTFIDSPRSVIELIGANISQEKELYQKLLSSPQIDWFLGKMKRELDMRMTAQAPDDIDPLVFRTTADFVAAGLVDLYRAWLEGDYGDLPIEKLDDLATKLVQANLAAALG